MPPTPTANTPQAGSESGSKSKTYYAWSQFRITKDDKRVVIKEGEEVTASKLDVSDDEFQGLVENGSVRTTEYPDAAKDGSTTPTRHLASLLAEAQGQETE